MKMLLFMMDYMNQMTLNQSFCVNLHFKKPPWVDISFKKQPWIDQSLSQQGSNLVGSFAAAS